MFALRELMGGHTMRISALILLAAAAMSGGSATAADLFVYDADGNLVTSDVDSTDQCVVRFAPTDTISFRIEVRNLGGVYNRYTMRTN